ncbi:MAG: diversity-generating retroelement protein Avd [Gammaproteobacteria bacterium]|nr:diversity-generating retroelement protein Avd [Gammaproteobacteria bacterium]
MAESPLFTRTYDLMQWTLVKTTGFPRSYRASLGRRIQEQAFALYETLIVASRDTEPLILLKRADGRLAALRGYLRLSQELHLISLKQYGHVAKICDEVGRMLGGWMRKQPK